MKKTFELLQRKGFRSKKSILKIIMEKYNVSKIIEFNRELLDTCDLIQIPERTFESGPFNFVCNSEMTAQHFRSCEIMDCRLSHMKKTATFASLYSDTIYINNYFLDYKNVNIDGLGRSGELDLKYKYAGDLLILFTFRPLFEQGILKLIPASFHYCPDCLKKFSLDSFMTKRITVTNFLSDEYIKNCKAELTYNKKYSRNILALHIKGPEELYEGGGMVRFLQRLPDDILKKSGFLDSVSINNSHSLTRDDMKKLKIPEIDIRQVSDDITFHHLLSLKMNARYLTNREIDIKFLQLINDGRFEKSNNIIKNELLCKIPIFENVPFKKILTIRKNEYEAFLLFRKSIENIVDNYLIQKKQLTRADAKDMYRDEIYPQIANLNKSVRTLKKGAILKNIANAIVDSGLLSFGLYRGFLPVTAIAAAKLLNDGINALSSISEVTNQARKDNLFFLWKLRKKLPKH